MDLKNAIAVCLISLFSATLVVLIARALDRQAASRLEPQLTKIADELELLRKQGGLVAASANPDESDSPEDGLVVYYFHSSARCPTCRAIESQSYATVQTDFADELESGDVTWKILNYEQPAVAPLAKRFEIQMPVVVLARLREQRIDDWKRLDRVWALVGDKPAFAEYVREEINQMLGKEDTRPTAIPPGGPADIPAATVDRDGVATSSIPDPNVPTQSVPADLPVPQ